MEMQDYFDLANENFYIGEDKLNNGEVKESREFFQTAIDNYILGINYDDITVHNIWLKRDAYNKMSQAYWRLGKLELAIYANNKVLELDPFSEYGLNNKEFFESVKNNTINGGK